MQVTNKIYVFILVVFIATILLSCGENSIPDNSTNISMIQNVGKTAPTLMPESKESIAEYVAWVKNDEHGYIKKKNIGSIEYTAMLKPSAYTALQTTKGNVISEIELVNQVKQYTSQEVELTIQAKGFGDELLKFRVSDMADYQQRVNYFSFQLDKDALLVVDGDTLPCLIHHWERAFDARDKAVIQLAFDKKRISEQTEEATFIYYDRVFGSGLIKFQFGKSNT